MDGSSGWINIYPGDELFAPSCSIHHMPDVLVCLILSINIAIACSTFHFLVPVYGYDLFGREHRLELDGILSTQFVYGCLYQYVMSE